MSLAHYYWGRYCTLHQYACNASCCSRPSAGGIGMLHVAHQSNNQMGMSCTLAGAHRLGTFREDSRRKQGLTLQYTLLCWPEFPMDESNLKRRYIGWNAIALAVPFTVGSSMERRYAPTRLTPSSLRRDPQQQQEPPQTS